MFGQFADPSKSDFQNPLGFGLQGPGSDLQAAGRKPPDRCSSHCSEAANVGPMVQCLHGLVTYGPGDLDIAWAMSAHGYDAVKWAEGQCILAELVGNDAPAAPSLAAARAWYDEAAHAARRALATHPRLLAKMGLA